MTVYVDTSGIYALLNVVDENHEAALGVWQKLSRVNEDLATSNYVLLETLSLIQRRMGVRAVSDFQTGVVPLLRVTWIDSSLHNRAMASLLTAGRRDLSLVDCASFEVMRLLGLDAAFAFDDHFRQQGFSCVP